MRDNKWVRLLAYITGLVNQRLLLQNEYLVAENRILRSHLPSRLRLSGPERSTLAAIGKRVGRKDPPSRSQIRSWLGPPAGQGAMKSCEEEPHNRSGSHVQDFIRH